MKKLLITVFLLMSSLTMASDKSTLESKLELGHDKGQVKSLLMQALSNKCDSSKKASKCQMAQMKKMQDNFKKRVEQSLNANPNEDLSSEIGDGGWNFEGDEMTIEDTLFLIILDEIMASDIDADINEIIETIINI